MNSNTGRHVGVMIPEGQRRPVSDKPAGTITGFTPIKLVGIEYVNAQGRQDTMLAVITSENKVFAAPNGGAWFSGCSPVSERMSEDILRLLPKEVPAAEDVSEAGAADKIDVLGT